MINQTLNDIKQTVAFFSPDNEIILFGSRARNDHTETSDYDIMVIIPGSISIEEKIKLSGMITRALAKKKISADVLIESREEIDIKKALPGTIVREAVREGIRI
ncbi:MAG TPA: nucleotidyltransferase domain-containing protein [Spirochaetota bacterium]|nr:nucleotidyltransferase domain-containing protein [Spirochaetota bacterium]HPC41157.1 nucleotidyltransferase domain-containing protein [Spirochaetota bacterium]HPL18867.1 nucleotidyltransferase domain-containing protein [Spirochaetota bacterium]HQF07077.1 nucleotidyltransferase domain-containing protein [Spirochaetota bacterium]HQH95814.1 nucleotidyltransferase domain-containing protein [Spirochaetota bacterium]